MVATRVPGQDRPPPAEAFTVPIDKLGNPDQPSRAGPATGAGAQSRGCVIAARPGLLRSRKTSALVSDFSPVFAATAAASPGADQASCNSR